MRRRENTRNKFLPATIQGIGLLALIVLFLQAFVSFFRILWFVQVAERSLADIQPGYLF